MIYFLTCFIFWLFVFLFSVERYLEEMHVYSTVH